MKVISQQTGFSQDGSPPLGDSLHEQSGDLLREGGVVLDIFGNASVVRVDASDWVDYLQVAKVDDKWVIINVLWAWRPEALERMTRQR